MSNKNKNFIFKLSHNISYKIYLGTLPFVESLTTLLKSDIAQSEIHSPPYNKYKPINNISALPLKSKGVIQKIIPGRAIHYNFKNDSKNYITRKH